MTAYVYTKLAEEGITDNFLCNQHIDMTKYNLDIFKSNYPHDEERQEIMAAIDIAIDELKQKNQFRPFDINEIRVEDKKNQKNTRKTKKEIEK